MQYLFFRKTQLFILLLPYMDSYRCMHHCDHEPLLTSSDQLMMEKTYIESIVLLFEAVEEEMSIDLSSPTYMHQHAAL